MAELKIVSLSFEWASKAAAVEELPLPPTAPLGSLPNDLSYFIGFRMALCMLELCLA